MTVYYAIVDGDPLSSGGRVHVPSDDEWIEDPDGRMRAVAYLGDKAWCTACQTWGTIVSRSGVADFLRTVHYRRGKQAVSGDAVVCRCASMPVLLAVYGRRESFHDIEDSTSVSSTSPKPPRIAFDEQFSLADGRGQPLRGARYRVRAGADIVAQGVTDAGGRTVRITTDGSKPLQLDIAH